MHYTQLVEDFSRLFTQLKQSIFQFAPSVLAALVIFLFGLLLARLLKALLDRFITHLDRLIPNRTVQRRLRPFLREQPIARIVSSVVYWMLILFFLTMATETLGLPVVTTWLSGITGYVPKILAAVLIGCAGLIGGVIVRDLVITTSASAGLPYGTMIGNVAQISILLVTVLIGIEHMDIEVTLLTNILTISLGALLFGAALAFGLGARTAVSNILASHYLQKTYMVGQMVQIGATRGRIVQITPIAVIVEATEGQVYIPAKDFSEVTSVLLPEEA